MTRDATALIEGPAAERAVECAIDVADAIGSVDLATAGPGLSRGVSGFALFYTLLAEVTGDATYRETAATLAERAVAQASEATIGTDLYGNTVGVGWTLTALTGRLFDADEDDPGADDLVEHVLTFDPWPGHYDLVNGLTGLGVYWLSRLPQPRALAGLARVVEHLAAMAERRDGAATWFTTPAMFAGRVRQFPDGHYDAGFAHGVSGVIALLAEAVRAGVSSAAPLLEDAVQWLLRRRLDEPGGSRYPGLLGPGETAPHPTRMAWCYGDPGVAVALTAAGRALGSADVLAEALATARGCAGRGSSSQIEDSGLCHGSGGVAHVLDRVARAHGDEQLRDVARQWILHTLDHRGTDPYAGFPTRNSGVPLSDQHAYVPRAGVLEGAAGTGLALLSATTPARPWWDGFYLVADLY